MFRSNTSSTQLQYLQRNNNSLRNSLKRGKSENVGGKRRINSKKNRRDFEEKVPIGKVQLIVHLCINEVVSRGLTEPEIFKPLRIGEESDKVRYLINCILRDNRLEFEDELGYQNIHNVVSGIRLTLRSCSSNIVPFEYYEEFVRYEQEWQYDPRKGFFNHFLSHLSRHSKTILLELFDLFAMTMENSHINLVHPARIIKSMSLQIFNDSKNKSYENFELAYQEWLKCSNALIHLFLAYLRERACSTQLPERLHLLLRDYVDCRKKCLMNSSVSGNGKDIIISEHVLPDITIADLDEVINSSTPNNYNNNKFNGSNTSNTISKRSSVIKKSTKTINSNKSNRESKTSLSDMFPELFDTLNTIKRKASFKSSPNLVLMNDPKTADAKWDELQNRGLDILSEEALKLFFAYDDRYVNTNPITFEGKKSEKKRNANKGKYEKPTTLEPIPKMEYYGNSFYLSEGNFNNDTSGSEYPDDRSSFDDQTKFGNKGLRESVDSSSNVFSLSSTVAPSSSDSGGNRNFGGGINNNNYYNESRMNCNDSPTLGNTMHEESQEVRNQATSSNRKTIPFLCIRRRPRSSASADAAYMRGEDLEDWHVIEQTVDISDYLTVEVIDALFPYVWIEANIDEDDEQWGEWIFIEPRSGLIHECEWIMIEDKKQYMSDWEQNLNNTNNIALANRSSSRLSKISALSNISISLPWIKNSKKSASNKSITSKKSNLSNNSNTKPQFNNNSIRSNNSNYDLSSSYMQRPSTPTERVDNTSIERSNEFRNIYQKYQQQQQQEEEESKLYHIQKYQQEQQKLVIEQQEERKRQEREKLRQAQEKEEEANQYYKDVYEQYQSEVQKDYYEENDEEYSRPQIKKQNSSQQLRRPSMQNQTSQQFRPPIQKQPSQQQYQNYENQGHERERQSNYNDEYYNQPYPQSVHQSPVLGRASPNLGNKSPYSSSRGRELPFSVNPRGGASPRQSPIMANRQLSGRQTPRQPTPQLSDQMNQMNSGRQSPMDVRRQKSPMMNHAQLPIGSPVRMNAKLPNGSPVLTNAQLPSRSPRQNPRTPPMKNAQLPQQQPKFSQHYQQQFQQMGYPQQYPQRDYQQFPPQDQYSQSSQQYPPQDQYSQSSQQYSPQDQYSQPSQQYSSQQYPQHPQQQYPQQYTGTEVIVNKPQSPLMNAGSQNVNAQFNEGPIITQTTTNKIETSRKIQVPNANNTTTEIEETVVKYENVTVSTKSTIKPQPRQYENDYFNGNTRSPTESEIIDGYTVPEQNQLTYNPPGSYGPFPVSYPQIPPSPIMNTQRGYVAAQREQPTSIKSNIPPEFYKQQPNLYNNIPSELYNSYNNLPVQVPMSIPMDVAAQQTYLKYPTNVSSSTTPQQQPYFPPGYVSTDANDKKGKGKTKRYMITN